MITTNKEPKDIFLKLSPWGLLFAEHSNLKAGYFSQERYLVTKYLKEKLNILIIGSGNGREAFPVCHDGHRIVCMDTGLLYLMAGKQFFAKENVRNIYFVQADMAQFPFNEKSFDFIFFSLYSPAGRHRFDIMRKISSILCKGGLVLLMTVNFRRHAIGKDFAVISDERQLRQELSLCGFELLETKLETMRPEYRFSVCKRKSDFILPQHKFYNGKAG